MSFMPNRHIFLYHTQKNMFTIRGKCTKGYKNKKIFLTNALPDSGLDPVGGEYEESNPRFVSPQYFSIRPVGGRLVTC